MSAYREALVAEARTAPRTPWWRLLRALLWGTLWRLVRRRRRLALIEERERIGQAQLEWQERELEYERARQERKRRIALAEELRAEARSQKEVEALGEAARLGLRYVAAKRKATYR